ncbi:hypothetical protein BDZ90DRAFT_257732 [Jaminaea rosea]|uniref:Uncharacterized protein n=1 Tax=Jaminaea rosea TaxID=1569628 RepID=A0A316UZL0_9BASI|nr:hypothetical protein BDZ90DRAFT_257732 [Jaminaea rosea]PWN30662.1 hypothetical protein BDZ90DRAFT_257732 [Jaminaea rosea]
MLSLIPFVLTALLSVVPILTGAQKPIGTSYSGQNLLASSHPFAITARDSNVVLFAPIPKSTASSLLPKGVSLLPTHPISGFKDDEWPLLLNLGLDKDLNEYSLSRVDFHHGYIGIPWTDKSKDGKTPFTSSFDVLFSDNLFIAASSQLLAGFNSIPMTFAPETDPFVNGSGTYKAVKDQHTYFDLSYAKAGDEGARISRSTYVDVLTQGRFQNSGCLYHEQYFNFTNTDPYDILADVRITDSWVPSAIAGTYKQARGLRLNQHWIETISQPCKGRGVAHGEL